MELDYLDVESNKMNKAQSIYVDVCERSNEREGISENDQVDNGQERQSITSRKDDFLNAESGDSENDSVEGNFTSTPQPVIIVTEETSDSRSFDFPNTASTSTSSPRRLEIQRPLKKLSVGGISSITPCSPNKPKKILRDTSIRTSVLIRNHESLNYSLNYLSVGAKEADLTTHSPVEIVPMQRGLTLTCHNVRLHVPVQKSKSYRLKRVLLRPFANLPRESVASSSSHDISTETHTKVILHGMSLGFPPGLNAIMGPSGGGKTSLLRILSLRNRNVEGTIRLNGNPAPDQFAQLCGFSVQDDILNPTLSAREHLWFSLCLRRGGMLKKRERKVLVNEILKSLKLESCCDKKVGDPADTKLSGGERKRTAIGMELAAAPKVLFLDEPTSMLDSTMSKSVIQILKDLADNGRTIILTIHQPSFAIYQLFDTLTLIARGRTVYHGPAASALDYFTLLGFSREPYHSPPDFFLDILFGNVTSRRRRQSKKSTPHPRRFNSVKQIDHTHAYLSVLYQSRPESVEEAASGRKGSTRVLPQPTVPIITVTPDPDDSYGVNNNLEKSGETEQEPNKHSDVWFTTMTSHLPANEEVYLSKLDASTHEGNKEHTAVAEWLAMMYSCSNLGQENEVRLNELQRDGLTGAELHLEMKRARMARKSSFISEFYLLTKRSLKSSKKLCVALVVMNVVIGLLFGALYYHPRYDERPMVQNRLGMFFYLSVHGMMVPSMITAKSFVVAEKTLVQHEIRSGYYRAISYCFGRFVVVLLARVLSSISLSLGVYWLVGLRPTAAAFLLFLTTTFTAGLACDTLCLLSAIGCRCFATGRSLVVLYMSLTSVFAGFLLELNSAFPWLSWIKYISITRYCYLSWVIGEFSSSSLQPCPRTMNTEISDNSRRSEIECNADSYEGVIKGVVGSDHYIMEHPWLNHVILIVISVFCLVLCYLRMRKLH